MRALQTENRLTINKNTETMSTPTTQRGEQGVWTSVSKKGKLVRSLKNATSYIGIIEDEFGINKKINKNITQEERVQVEEEVAKPDS